MTDINNLEVHDDYVVLHLSGAALPAEEILTTMQDVLRFCKDHHICKGIIYRSEPARQTATLFNFYEFSKFLASQQLFGYRFALVFPQEGPEDKIDFLQTASENRSVNLQRFATYEDAVAWLKT